MISVISFHNHIGILTSWLGFCHFTLLGESLIIVDTYFPHSTPIWIETFKETELIIIL